MSGRVPEFWHVSADAIVATVAGGLVLLVFYPLTLCASGVKRLVRMARGSERVDPLSSGYRAATARERT
jgi:hypothetical protein